MVNTKIRHLKGKYHFGGLCNNRLLSSTLNEARWILRSFYTASLISALQESDLSGECLQI